MERNRLPARLAWFAGLWVASIFVLGVVAYAIKFAIL